MAPGTDGPEFETKGAKAVSVEVEQKMRNAQGEIVAAGRLATAEDSTLIAAAKRGSSQAFGVLVERYRSKILSTTLRLTRNREDAEDAAQQTFQKAFCSLQQFEGRSLFCTWLTRIALNEALMLLRIDRRSRELPLDDSGIMDEGDFVPKIRDSGPNPEHSYSQQERRQLLSVAMQELKPKMRQAVQLSGLEELSLKRTAQIMGVSVSATKSRVLRGRRRLRETLSRYVESPQSLRRSTLAM